MRLIIMKNTNSGKQRKAFYNAPLHKKRKMMSSHLEENLLLKYDKRSIPIVRGDTVRVTRGSFKGHEDKIVKINTKKNTVNIEGLTMAKADGNKIPKPVHPSNLIITKLNLTDKWRREKLQRDLSEETKKEIEKEAKEQIIQAEEEQKRFEEELAIKKAEEEKEELGEQIESEEKIETEKITPSKKKTDDTKDEKKDTKVKPAEEKTTPAKKETKSKTEKRSTAKKTKDTKEEKKKTSKKDTTIKKEEK
jgi:large subunit ribosomal protein L24